MGGNTASAMQSPVIVAATAKHTATVIFLHGLGDTGLGWSSVFEAIRQPHVKYICPTAPVIPVTLNGGMRMTAWFDLCSLDPNGREDESGIKSAAEGIHRLIADEEKAGISSERIVLGGFSMGGALALYSGLRYPKPLAGILGLSCWLPLFKQFPVKGAPLSAEVVQHEAKLPPHRSTKKSEVNLTNLDHPGQSRMGQRQFIPRKVAVPKKGAATEDAEPPSSADCVHGEEESAEVAASTSSSEPPSSSSSGRDGQEETTAAVGNHETPILLCHGDCDDLVPLHWGQLTSELLKKFAKDVTFRQYKGMGHSSCEEETKDVAAYLQSRLLPRPE